MQVVWLLCLPCQAEIHDDRFAAAIDHDVGGLQVAMHDPVVVGFLQGLRNLADDDQNLRRGLRDRGVDEVREGPSLDIRHRDVVLPVDVADVVDGANARMPQRGSGPRFAVEAFEQLPLIVACKLRRFERDLPAELRVLGEINCPHRALPQRTQDPIAPEVAGKLARFRAASRVGRSGRKRFVGVLAEGTGGFLRDVASRLGGEFPELVLGCDKLPQLGRDLPVLRQERFAVDRLFSIKTIEIVFERGLEPRIVRSFWSGLVHGSAFAGRVPREDKPTRVTSFDHCCKTP